MRLARGDWPRRALPKEPSREDFLPWRAGVVPQRLAGNLSLRREHLIRFGGGSRTTPCSARPRYRRRLLRPSMAGDEGLCGSGARHHLHFDHVLGLPFFEPINQPGARLDVYGPPQPQGSLADAFAALVRPPYFPLQLSELEGEVTFLEVSNDRFSLGAFQVVSRVVPHLGPTLGYRVECEGKVVAYISDHQAPVEQQGVADAVLELCEGADLLIHDAQYTRSEFMAKHDWGHSFVDYAVLVAAEAGARRLCLFHHDPSHGDEQLDEMLQSVRPAAQAAGVSVLHAAEGLVVTL